MRLRRILTCLGVILAAFCGDLVEAAAYKINWAHANTGLTISGQGTSAATVTGNVLNLTDNTDSGIDFTLSLVLTGGSGSGSTFVSGHPEIALNGGVNRSLEIDISGINRDASTLMTGTFSLSGGEQFADLTISFLDIDRSINNDWVDQVGIGFGAGSNTYRYDRDFIEEVSPNTFVGLENVNEALRDGNLRVRNSGILGSSLEFTYSGAADDNYTSNNQRISIGNNIRFDAIPVPIPEPSTMVLSAVGLGMLTFRRRKANKSA